MEHEHRNSSCKGTTRRRWFEIVLLLFTIGLVAILAWRYPPPARHEISTDLLAYYSAARVFFSGGNPFDVRALLEQTVAAVGSPVGIEFVWGLPWIHLFVGSLAWLPYEEFRRTWEALSLMLVGGSVIVLLNTFVPRNLPAPQERVAHALVVVFVCSFYPATVALWVAPVAPVLLACFALSVHLVVRHAEHSHWHLAAGGFLAFVTAKPHLLYLLYAALAVLAVQGRLRKLAAGFGAGVLSLAVVCLMINPAIIWNYLSSIHAFPLAYRTPALAGVLQTLVPGVPKGIVFLAPAAAVTGLVAIFLTRPIARSLQPHTLFVLYAPLSLICAPYLWVGDFTLLLPTAVWALAAAQRYKLHWPIVLLFAGNIGLWWGPKGMEHAWWYPLAVGGIASALYARASRVPVPSLAVGKR